VPFYNQISTRKRVDLIDEMPDKTETTIERVDTVGGVRTGTAWCV